MYFKLQLQSIGVANMVVGRDRAGVESTSLFQIKLEYLPIGIFVRVYLCKKLSIGISIGVR